ncbi:hypothetical protein, partial [Nocardiopsis synnemataformans]|uniref:hypothetical protein n=1 Tax=Nocardiopsis synnemataformans TaxID=61305 RepID=UPI003EBD2F6B
MSHYIASATAGGFLAEVTVDVPVQAEDGDLLVALVTANDQRDLTAPAEFELVATHEFEGNQVANWVATRDAANEPNSYTFTWSGDHWHFVELQVWRGVELIATAHASAGDVSAIDLPSVEAEAGDVLLAFGFHWDETERAWPYALIPITTLPRSIASAYTTVTATGPTAPHTLAAAEPGVMAATAILLRPTPTPILAQNRVWSCGFELQSLLDGVECDGGNGQVAISTDIVRSGQAALHCHTSEDTAFISHRVAATETSPWYLRAYVFIAELPDVTTSLLQAVDDANLVVASVRLTASGTLQLWDDDEIAGAQIGSDSVALTTQTWHRVELRVGPLDSGASARLDGVEFAEAALLTIGENVNRFRIGVCSPATTDLYIDDCAVNGDGEQTWPGEGRIIHLRPAGPGALSQWRSTTGGDTWQTVREISPDDSASYAWHSANGAAAAADSFALTPRPPALLDTDEVLLVQVGARVGSLGDTGTRDLALTLTSPDGTTLTGSTLSCALNGWVTHGVSDAHLYTLTSQVDPDASEEQRWTPAQLDGIEIGYTTVTSATVQRRVTTLWALVEYRDGGQAPPPAESADPSGVEGAFPGMPTLIVEASFSTSDGGLVFHLDDADRGRLDTNVLADATTFTDISPYVRAASTSRGSDRVSSPVVTYDAGSCTLVLDNTDRRFDPTNVDGPYTSGGRSQVTSMRPMRIRAEYGSTTNLVVNPDFADGYEGWEPNEQTTLAAVAPPVLLFGPRALEITRVTSNALDAHAAAAISSGFIGGTIAEGEPVTISAYIYLPSAVFEQITGISIGGRGGGLTDAVATEFVTLPTEPDTWHRVQLTGTVATDTVLYGVQISIWTDNSVADGTVVGYLNGVQAVPGVVPEDFVPNRRVYDLVRGYADAWPITWSDPHESTVEVTFTDAFKVLNQRELTAVETPVGASEDAGARITRVLDAIEWPDGDRDIATGDSTLQATLLEGAALEQMQDATASEIGELYMSGAGKVTFRNRTAISTAFRSIQPQALFGDREGEVRYQGLTLTADDEQLANIIKAAREGDDAIEQVVTDEQSIAQYQGRTYDASGLLLETDAAAADYAHYLLYQSSEPELRFESLTLSARSDPGRAMPMALGLEIGDRIRIRRRPPGGGVLIERDCFVRGIQHEISPDNWTTTFALQSATRAAFLVLDDAILGQLDHNALG